MPTTLPTHRRVRSRRRTALLGVLVAAACALTAGVVVPAAGAASGGGSSTTGTPSVRTVLEDFEAGRPTWGGLGLSEAETSDTVALSGAYSLAITSPGVASGAIGWVDTGASRAWVSLALRLEAGPADAVPAEARFRVIMQNKVGETTEVSDVVHADGWTTIGGWINGPSVQLIVFLSDDCRGFVPGRLFVDDVVATAYPEDVLSPTTSPAATSLTAMAPTSTAPTSATAPAATSTPTSPVATTTSRPLCVPGPRTTTGTSKLRLGFEDGTSTGWTPVGRSKLQVGALSARSGSAGMRVTKLDPNRASGATLTVPLAGIPGTGRWVRVALWVRGPKPASTTTRKGTFAQQVGPLATTGKPGRLRLLGPDGSVVGVPTTLPGKQWVQLVADVQVAQGATDVSITLGQEPPTRCGATAKPIGAIDVDDLELTRYPAAPSTTTMPPAQPFCRVTKADRSGAGVPVAGEVAPQGIGHVTKY